MSSSSAAAAIAAASESIIPSSLLPYIPTPIRTKVQSITWASLQNDVLITNLVPDAILRRGVRFLLADRLRELYTGSVTEQQQRKQQFIAQLKQLPIAIQTQNANEQHYTIPTPFYLACLGSRLKYSCGYYTTPKSTLDEAEVAMLNLYVERAQLEDGQSIMDLGCGWGSFALFAAQKFPNSRIVAVSNSPTQKAHIEHQARTHGYTNLTVITCDINQFTMQHVVDAVSHSHRHENGNTKNKHTEYKHEELRFDRVVSIEMFEHMKNYELLFQKVSSFLKPQGKLFTHIFVHKQQPYHFEGDSWMAKYFFSGGTMPSTDLFLHFQRHLTIDHTWYVDGTHYARTSEDWLIKMGAHAKEIKACFKESFGEADVRRWWVMWRTFYIAVAEMFAYNNGSEWFVAHYLFSNKSDK